MTFKRLLVVALLVLPPLVLAGYALADSGTAGLRKAKQATAKYKDAERAKAAGYALELADRFGETCIVDLEAKPKGGMGVHLVNEKLLDAKLDPRKPEALVYDPNANGGLKLVAVEYVVFQEAWDTAKGARAGKHASAPRLFGRKFGFNDGTRFKLPAFWALHAWIWQRNPSPFGGVFAAWNPRVSC
jgi:hypothetical protein